jgi:hypothetical protein
LFTNLIRTFTPFFTVRVNPDGWSLNPFEVIGTTISVAEEPVGACTAGCSVG